VTRRVRPGFFARDDMWGPGISDRRGGNSVPIRKRGGDGPWAVSGSRPKHCRRPLFPFLILFPFF
jgi:hypothetical protein